MDPSLGEERPKQKWPKLEVDVEEAKIALLMTYRPVTQIAERAQNRIVDLKGRGEGCQASITSQRSRVFLDYSIG